MAKILITGANGYIGHSFIKAFHATHECIPVRLQSTPIETIAFDGVETVLHLSALVHQTQTRPDSEYEAINVTNTLHLAQRAKASGVGHFIFMSSVSVYGCNGRLDGPLVLNEESPCHPTSAYGRSKLRAEKRLEDLVDDRFIVTIIRAPMVYGKDAPGNMHRLIKLIRTLPILPFECENRRSLIYIDNLVYFIHRMIQNPLGGVVLVQDQEILSLFELTNTLANAMMLKRHFIAPPSLVLNIGLKLGVKTIQRLYGHLVLDSSQSNARLDSIPPVSSVEALTFTAR